MNRKGKAEGGESGLLWIIGIIIIVLVALAFLSSGAITTPISKISDTQRFTNDSINISSAALNGAPGQVNSTVQFNITKVQTDWRTTGCPISSYTFTNGNGTAFTETTDYVFTAAIGNFTLKNTSVVNNTILGGNNLTLVNYTYCDSGYSTDSSARAGAKLIATIAVVILLFFLASGIKEKFEER